MLLKKIEATIRQYNLIAKKDKILIGVSGGPDSVALVYLLNGLKKKLKISLHIAHLDHMLREDSGKDSEYVGRLGNKLGIPVTTAQINLKALAVHGSVEEIARNARFGFFFRAAKEIKAAKIALGHNLDDQAETVLMRILRGSGLYGLAGILPKRNIGGFTLIRPLIEIRRGEIEAFLRQRRIKPRRDMTNKDEIYFRNKIRNKLLPLLEKGYNRNIKEVLSNMAENIGYDYDCLTILARRIEKRLGNRIYLAKFLKLHPAVQRLLLRRNISRLQGSTRRIGFQHIKEIEDLILNRPTHSIVDLPAGISVIKEKKTIRFYQR